MNWAKMRCFDLSYPPLICSSRLLRQTLELLPPVALLSASGRPPPPAQLPPRRSVDHQHFIMKRDVSTCNSSAHPLTVFHSQYFHCHCSSAMAFMSLHFVITRCLHFALRVLAKGSSFYWWCSGISIRFRTPRWSVWNVFWFKYLPFCPAASR